MVDIGGTNVAAAIVPFTSEDTYPSHISTYGKGGWHEVSSIQERDEIPNERRILGMAVFVTENNTIYILQTTLENSGWTIFQGGEGSNVPEWALQPTKPTYTASEITTTEGGNVQEVLATKADTSAIPTNISQLENDSNYATKEYVDSKETQLLWKSIE